MTSDGKEISINLKHVSWGITVALVTWGATIVGVAWTLSSDRAQVIARVTTAESQIGDHEARIRRLEESTQTIAADLRWIRETLERNLATNK